ncbi:hypothetical protein GCM10010336_33150 [Streptomyces goshikiensis]|nr:hypothetical protein GCM10010336_33150 [Streptomyces goshikiensis]
MTDSVLITIEITYRRCRPRTSSARPIRAPVIRKTSAPFRFVRCTLHHPIRPPDTPRPGDNHGTPPLRRCGGWV